ncbi:MAG: PDDEXK nuclease domain-containing protein [Candidatus Omnitrophota bacterium]
MKYSLVNDKEYKVWLADIKARVRSSQIKAALSVNTELLKLYWSMGENIVIRQKNTKWGDSLLLRLSRDLMAEFPEMKGFSERNLKYIRQWFLFYTKRETIRQQLVAQITKIPWGHNIAIISKCKDIKEALFYVQNTIKHSWSRSVLIHQMESGLFKRGGKAITNFPLTLPKPQSDLARQTLKDPYIFDFLSMSADYNERDLENKLIEHLTSFLLELGAGFAFIGRQVSVQVGVREFFIDLLFYHTRLHCYVGVELKTGDFEPEYAGKLNFYIKAIDSQLHKEGDMPTIGLLLCKSRDKLVAEYALSDIHKPIGVSEYKLTHSLPRKLKSSFPTVEEIEKELSKGIDKTKK